MKKSGIKDLVIPSTVDGMPVTSILSLAFSGNTDLVNVTIPSTVTSIGNNAFYGCTSLRQVYVEGIVTDLGLNIFKGCDYNNLEVYGIISTELDNYCQQEGISFNVGTYWGCFKIYVNGDNEATIAGLVDHHCNTSHRYITIPSEINGMRVVGIHRDAFKGSDVVSVNISVKIPKSGGVDVGTYLIDEGAFANCASLKSIYLLDDGYKVEFAEGAIDNYGAGLTVYATGDGNLVNTDAELLRDAYISAITISDVFVVSDVTGGYKVIGLTSEGLEMGKIRMPDTIKGKNVVAIGNLAFMGDVNLTTMILGKYVTSIGEHAFEECTNLTYVFMPDSLTEIKRSAFADCTSLRSIMLGENVESVGDYAFSGCSALKEFRISNPDCKLGEKIFDGIKGNIDFVEVPSSASKLYTYFRNNYSTKAKYIENLSTAVKYRECFTYEVVLDDDTYGDYIIITGLKTHSGCAVGNHKNVIIPAYIGGLPVKMIQRRAFAGNTVIQSVIAEVGEGLILYEGVFQNCVNLGSADLGKVQQIYMYAFKGCGNLASVSLSLMSNTVLGKADDADDQRIAEVFEGCTNLKEIVIDDSYVSASRVRYYSKNGAVYDKKNTLLLCYDLSTDTFAPDNAVAIANGAFTGCGKIRTLVLPASVTVFNTSVLFDNEGNLILTNLSKLYVNADRMQIIGADKLANVEVYYPIDCEPVTDSPLVSTFEYIPQRYFDFNLRVEDLTDGYVYVLNGVNYVYSQAVSAWVESTGNYSVLLADAYFKNNYNVFTKLGEDNVYYVYANGEFTSVSITSDMISETQKMYTIYPIANINKLIEVNVVNGLVYYKSDLLSSRNQYNDVYVKYSAIIRNGDRDLVSVVYVNRGNGLAYSFDESTASFVKVNGDAYLLHNALLLESDSFQYYIRTEDNALISANAEGLGLIYDVYANGEYYYLNENNDFVLATVIADVVYDNGEAVSVMGVPVRPQDLYLRKFAHVKSGVERNVYAYVKLSDNSVYLYEAKGAATLLTEEYDLYEIKSVLTGQTQGAIVSVKNVNDTDWNKSVYSDDVKIPDFAYINGVSYPVVEIGLRGFKDSKATKITVSGNIATVGDHAFENSSKLQTVEFKNSVTTLGDNVFAGCNALKTVNIGENINSIDGNMFTERAYVLDNDGNINAATDLTVIVAVNNQPFKNDSK